MTTKFDKKNKNTENILFHSPVESTEGKNAQFVMKSAVRATLQEEIC